MNPLVPPSWDYFCLDQVLYHGLTLTILFDKTGSRYGKGKGLHVFVDGKEIAASEKLERVTGALPPRPPEEASAGWTKFEGNPVMGGKFGTCFDVSVLARSPNVSHVAFVAAQEIAGDRREHGWHPLERAAAGRARAAPETGWEDDINRPCVLKRGDIFHMWYTGQAKGHSSIGYATSQDGVSWKRMSDKPVLTVDQPWELNVAVMCPWVIWDEAAKLFRMWYSGGEQNEPNAIGYATSSRRAHLEKVPG